MPRPSATRLTCVLATLALGLALRFPVLAGAQAPAWYTLEPELKASVAADHTSSPSHTVKCRLHARGWGRSYHSCDQPTVQLQAYSRSLVRSGVADQGVDDAASCAVTCTTPAINWSASCLNNRSQYEAPVPPCNPMFQGYWDAAAECSQRGGALPDLGEEGVWELVAAVCAGGLGWVSDARCAGTEHTGIA